MSKSAETTTILIIIVSFEFSLTGKILAPSVLVCVAAIVVEVNKEYVDKFGLVVGEVVVKKIFKVVGFEVEVNRECVGEVNGECVGEVDGKVAGEEVGVRTFPKASKFSKLSKCYQGINNYISL